MNFLSIWQRPLVVAFLLILPFAKAAPPYQETAWDKLIPEAGQIRDVNAYLNGVIEPRAAHGNPALQGKAIMIRGYVVPLEREGRSVLREFLLVPYFGACIHTPPPPANQVIHVRAEQSAPDIQAMTPVTVYGNLSLEGTSEKEGNAAYSLQAHRIETGRPDAMLPILLTLLCGLSAGIGALAACFVPRAHTRAICLCLGFSAGIMLWLGFSPLFLKNADWQALLWFLAGILLVGTPELLLRRKKKPGEAAAGQKIQSAGKFSALAVAAHSFPESLAVFSAALIDPVTGMVLCGAMMAHHLPLGLSIALPLRQTLGYRQSITYAFLAGLLPAAIIILAYLVIRPIFSPTHLGLFFSLAGGIMVFIAATKLIPSARSYGNPQTLCAGLMAGLLFTLFVLYLLSS